MFAVTATVDTVTIRNDWGSDWHGFCEIPEFLVEAGSTAEAEEMARNIVDPLHMTDIHITVTRVGRGRLSFRGRLWKAFTGS